MSGGVLQNKIFLLMPESSEEEHQSCAFNKPAEEGPGILSCQLIVFVCYWEMARLIPIGRYVPGV